MGLQEAIADVVRAAGLKFRTNSRSYIFDCPKCRRSDRLYMFRDDGRFYCAACVETSGFKGRPEFALTEMTGLSVTELQRRLYGAGSIQSTRYLDFDLGELLDGDEGEVLPDPPVPMAWPSHCLELEHQHAETGRAYLDGRGVPWQIAHQHYGVRYSPDFQALAFPLHLDSVLVGWQFRSVMTNPVLRYWSDPPALPRNRALMFSHRINGARAILSEGPFDAMKAHLCGGNVNAMGKEVADGQLGVLRCAGVKEVVIMVDPDAASAVEPLSLRVRRQQMQALEATVPKPYKDPGEMSMEAVEAVVCRAVPARFGLVRMDLDQVARKLGLS